MHFKSLKSYRLVQLRSQGKIVFWTNDGRQSPEKKDWWTKQKGKKIHSQQQIPLQWSSVECFLFTFGNTLKIGPHTCQSGNYSPPLGVLCLHHTTLNQPLLLIISLCRHMWFHDWKYNFLACWLCCYLLKTTTTNY